MSDESFLTPDGASWVTWGMWWQGREIPTEDDYSEGSDAWDDGYANTSRSALRDA